MIEIAFNDADVTRALERAAGRLADLTPLMQEIGDFLVRATKTRFAEGTSPKGATWAPKSEVTKAAYKRRGDPVDDRPLFGPSGALSSTIHYDAGPGEVRVGSATVYAATMQFGAAQGAFGAFIGIDSRGRRHFHPIPWGDIPARPFLGLSEADRDAIVEIVADYLDPAAGGA